MRKIVLALAAMAAAFFVGAKLFAPQLLPWEAVRVETDFQAAQRLLEACEQEEYSMIFQAAGRSEANIFRALEGTYPYAFSLHCTRHGDRTMTVRVQLDNEAAQKQAALLAQGVADSLITDDMLLRDRLRVLHDYVVQNCVYDTEIAARTPVTGGSGADAPFTAAGALVEGKAVCAGYARAYMLLCRAAGIDLVYISDQEMNHGWNAVRLYGDVRYIDATFDDPVPDRGELVSDAFFLRSADELAQTHTWDRDFYDELIDYALPHGLDKLQRLYDLGLLDEPPAAAAVDQPFSAAQRRSLEELTGIALEEELTAAQAGERLWQALCTGTLARELEQKGLFDEVRARQVGIPEEVMKKPVDKIEIM